jgi:hypothetical protein
MEGSQTMEKISTKPYKGLDEPINPHGTRKKRKIRLLETSQDYKL